MAEKFFLPLADQFGLAVASVFIVLGLALAYLDDPKPVEEFHQQYGDPPAEQGQPVDAKEVVASGHYELPYLYRMRI